MTDVIIDLIGALYGIAWIVASRMIAGHLAWRMHSVDLERNWRHQGRSAPTGEQWFGAIISALTIAALWPVALIWVLSGKLGSFGAEARALAEARDDRIKQLEKELNLTLNGG